MKCKRLPSRDAVNYIFTSRNRVWWLLQKHVIQQQPHFLHKNNPAILVPFVHLVLSMFKTLLFKEAFNISCLLLKITFLKFGSGLDIKGLLPQMACVKVFWKHLKTTLCNDFLLKKTSFINATSYRKYYKIITVLVFQFVKHILQHYQVCSKLMMSFFLSCKQDMTDTI